MLTFDRDVTSLVSSASGFQKKERSETDFVCGDTGEVMNFIEEVIRSDMTCCMGVSCEGTDVVMILPTGKVSER